MVLLGFEDVALKLELAPEAEAGGLFAQAGIGSHDCLYCYMLASCYSLVKLGTGQSVRLCEPYLQAATALHHLKTCT